MKKNRLLSLILILLMPISTLALEEKSLDDLWEEAQEFIVVTVVTASRTEATFEEAPGVVSAITRDEFIQMGARTMEDVLNLIPSFSVGRTIYSGQHQTLNVRGKHSFFGESILFLVNGQRINDGISGGVLTSVRDMPLDNIKQIEIIRGPGSSLYGASAFVGVVNIITLSPEELDGGNIYCRMGTNEGRFQTFEYGKSLDNGIRLSFHNSYTKWNDEELPQRDYILQVPNPGGEILEPYLFRFNVPFTNRNNIDAVEISQVGGCIGYKNIGIDVTYEQSDNNDTWGAGAMKGYEDEKYRSTMETENFRIGGQYNYNPTENIKINALGGYFHHSPLALDSGVNIANTPDDFPRPDTLIQYMFYEKKESDSYNFESSISWDITPQHNLIAGVNYQKDALKSMRIGEISPVFPIDSLNLIEGKERNLTAGFIQYNWKPYQWISLTAGLRGDYYDDFDWEMKKNLNPRFAAVFSYNETATLKLLYGQAFRAPSLYEKYLEEYGGNPDLKPETNKTYEVQINYRPISKLMLSGTGYYYEIEDGIDIGDTGQFENYGTYKSQGIEFEAKYNASQSLWAFINYSYNNCIVERWDYFNLKNVETDVDGIARSNLNFGINAEFFDKLSLNLNGTGRFDWVPQEAVYWYIPADYAQLLKDNLPPDYHDTIDEFEMTLIPETTFPDYITFNTHIELKDILPLATFTFDIRNILDEEQYVSEPLHNYGPGGISVNGRQILGGVRVEF